MPQRLRPRRPVISRVWRRVSIRELSTAYAVNCSRAQIRPNRVDALQCRCALNVIGVTGDAEETHLNAIGHYRDATEVGRLAAAIGINYQDANLVGGRAAGESITD